MPVTQHLDMPLQPYRYTSLETYAHLRILQLQAAPKDSNVVECKLIQIGPKDETLKYEALSWCWGKWNPNRTLRLRVANEVFSFKISSQLEDALKALRHESRDRNLWIDAICIDQSNVQERNEQVPRMNKIYGNATNACIWLGPADKHSQKAMPFIKDTLLGLWEFDNITKSIKESGSWEALVELMKRPWFSRRWIVQELSLAKWAWVYCGDDFVTWEEFADAVSLFVEAEAENNSLHSLVHETRDYRRDNNAFGDMKALGAAQLVEVTSTFFRTSTGGKMKVLSSLEDLVSRLPIFEATEPRDTIYALLAMARDSKSDIGEHSLPSDWNAAQRDVIKRAKRLLPATVSEQYPVDYQEPVIDVYQRFIDFSIRKSDQTKALDIICRPWAPRYKRRNDEQLLGGERPIHEGQASDPRLDEWGIMPSWIADLRGSPFRMKESQSNRTSDADRETTSPEDLQDTFNRSMQRINADTLVGMPNAAQRIYRAAETKVVNRKRLRFRRRRDHYSMFVEGFILNEVETAEERSQSGNIPASWMRAINWTNVQQEPPKEKWDAFWRTLVADRGPDGRSPPTYYPRACKQILRHHQDIHHDMDTGRLTYLGDSTIVARFLRRVQATIWGRTLIRTKDEPQLGLASAKTQPGDLVCILYGCSVPVILRKLPIPEKEQDDEDDKQQEAARAQEAGNIIKKNWKIRQDRRAELGLKQETALTSHIHKARNVARLAWCFAVAAYVGLRLRKETLAAFVLALGFIPLKELWPKRHTVDVARKLRRALEKLKQMLGAPHGHGEPPPSPSTTRQWMLKLVNMMQRNVVEDSWVVTMSKAVIVMATLASVSALMWYKSPAEYFAIVFSTALFYPRPVSGSKLPASKKKIPNKDPVHKSDHYYEFLGECYIHGMMDGEAIAWQNKHLPDIPHAAPRLFELR